MRLVYILLSPTFGMHQYTADIANRVAAHHEVHLVTMKGYPADRYGPDVIRHSPVSLHNTGFSIEGARLGKLARLKRVVLSLEPDLVHITGPHIWNLTLARTLRKSGILVIHTIHDLDPHSGTRMGILISVWNWLIIRSVDHIVVHGDRYFKRLALSGVPHDKVTCLPLLHLFVSHGNLEKAARLAEEQAYEQFALFFGRLELYKGVDVLLEAFTLIGSCKGEGQGNSPRLVMAGAGRLPKQWVERLPEGVEWRNRLIGDDEALRLFQRCALVVLPYHDATQSSIVAAAYYFRKPVIVTRVGALSEYVKEGKTGYIVPSNDSTKLAQAMSQIFFDEIHSRALGEAGRRWYDRQREKESATILQLYPTLLATRTEGGKGKNDEIVPSQINNY